MGNYETRDFYALLDDMIQTPQDYYACQGALSRIAAASAVRWHAEERAQAIGDYLTTTTDTDYGALETLGSGMLTRRQRNDLINQLLDEGMGQRELSRALRGTQGYISAAQISRIRGRTLREAGEYEPERRLRHIHNQKGR